MRTLGAALSFFLILAPTFTTAAGVVRPPLNASKCPSGVTTEVTSPRSTLFTKETDPAAGKRFLQGAIYCPNACYDLQANLTLTYSGLQVDVSGINKCSSSTKAPDDPTQSPPRGCTSGLQQPQITISTKDVYSRVYGFSVPDQSITKSRCLGNAIDAATNGFFSGLQQVLSNPQAGQAQMQSALGQFNAQPNNAPTPTVSTNVTTPEVIAKAQAALDSGNISAGLTSIGLPAAQVQNIVNSSPQQAQQLLKDIAAGDATAIQKDAANLNLNTSLTNDIVSINVGRPVGGGTGVDIGNPVPIDQNQNTFSASTLGGTSISARTTFYAPGAGGTIEGNFETSQPNLEGQRIPRTLDDFRLGNSPYVTLASDPSNYGKYFNLGTVTYTSPLDGKSYTLDNVTGYVHDTGSAFQGQPDKFDIALGNFSGWSAGAASSFVDRQTYGANQVHSWQQIGGPSGGTPTVTLSAAPSASPFSGLSGSYTPIPANMFGSPFAGASPYGTPSLPPATQSYSSPTYPQVPQPLPQPQIVSSVQNAIQAQVSAALTIIVQPTNAKVASQIVLSWAATGVNTSLPCSVQQNGLTIASDSSGSKYIQATATGTISFTLSCSSTLGNLIQKSASVTVH